jgi:Putative prokaryotic signal transducing protein
MLTTVTRFRDPWEAEMLCGLLDNEGIPAMTAFDRHIWVNWPISNALGGVRVQVPSEEYEAALRVWRDVQSGEYEAELERRFGPVERLRCPACGSGEVSCQVSIPMALLAGMLGLLVGAIFPPRKTVCECRNCRHIWDVGRA